jgi:hypothetical protein
MNNDTYHENLQNKGFEIKNNINDTLLVIGYDLMCLGQKESFEFLQSAGIDINEFSVENINLVRRKIVSQINKKNIAKIRNEIKETSTSQTFDEFVAQIEIGLERSIDVNLLTLSEWCAKVKSLDKKIEMQKKQLEKK